MNVDITLRGMPVDEELVYFVRRHASAMRRSGACSVAIDRTAGGYTVDVWVEGGSSLERGHVRQDEPNPFLAVRNAFCILTHPLQPELCDEAAE